MKCKIKYKLSIGILAVLISIVMLMSNALASNGIVWAFQTTLSTLDVRQSRDPENSGFGATQVVVWEEWGANSWDIYLKYHLGDGNPVGGWTFPPGAPPAHPAITAVDEINPAVTVTNAHPVSGLTEVHVVYQRRNPGPPANWDICHTWATIPAFVWTAPVVLDAVPANDATDPAIVFTEDLSFPGPLRGMLVQFTWSEWNPLGAPAIWEIQYDAYYYDPTVLPPGRGYVGATLIQGAATGATGDCLYPEIASVDEVINVLAYDYDFAIVWQEQTVVGQWNVWYIAGITTIVPGPPAAVPNGATLGQLNPVNVLGDCYHPDIAATHDYAGGPGGTYYYHVIWVYNIWGPPATWQIATCYAAVGAPNPVVALFVATASAVGPVNIVLDNPTIASKMVNLLPGPQFETWMCWEDNSAAPPQTPDIWYRVGLYNGVAFAYTVVAALVPYAPPGVSREFNPELWNRNDSGRAFPPLTHLVFDMTSAAAVQEVEYIDP